MIRKTRNEKRYELEQLMNKSLSDWPDSGIDLAYELLAVEADETASPALRSYAGWLYAYLEDNNNDFQMKLDELRNQVVRGAAYVGDYMGNWQDADEID